MTHHRTHHGATALPHLNGLSVLLMLATTLFLVVSAADSLWGSGVDFAHHYALIVRLWEHWTVPYIGDPSLGEMNYYPRSSHIVAAVWARLLGSALLGMQVTTLLSIVLVWASLLGLVLSLPRRVGLVAAFLLLVFQWGNYRYLHIELHGGEVVQNFFFAQLAAQAFVLGTLALTLGLERRGTPALARHLLMVCAIYLAAGIHLLPALELLAFFLALLSVDFFQQWRLGRMRWRRSLPQTIALAGAAIATLLLHPAFAIMRNLSNSNGDIVPRYLHRMDDFLLYSALQLLLALTLLGVWLAQGRKPQPEEPANANHHADPHAWLALKYMALYGLTISGLCILQVIALKLGHGSEYAVKKYIFALNTTLAVELAMAIALVFTWVAERWSRQRPTLDTSAASAADSIVHRLQPLLQPLLLPLLTVGAFLSVTPATPTMDTSDLVALEQRVLLRRDLALPSTPGKYDVAHQVHSTPHTATGFDPIIDYMLSIGLLNAPRVVTPLISKTGWDWSLVGTVITREGAELDRDPACRRAAPSNALVVLDGGCIGKRFGARYILGFTGNHLPHTCVTQGLSYTETFGTWTDGRTVRLRCPLPPPQAITPRSLQIDGVAFLDQLPVQRVIVRVNGGPPVEFRFDTSHPQRLLDLPLPQIAKGTEAAKDVTIELALPDAKSPAELGLSQDGRQLGLSIRTLEFK